MKGWHWSTFWVRNRCGNTPLKEDARRKEPFLVATLVMLAARETWSKNPTGVGEGWLQVDEVIKKIPGAEKTYWITPSFV